MLRYENQICNSAMISMILGLLNTVSAVEAAETIINEMRLRAPVVFIPGIYYYIHSICRLLPTHVQMLITDFIDTGIDINYDNFD